ncbi:MAG: hypothetical protein SFX73_00760 [Kofleriaceae bacterium]|nr:hypothetical protein [Kofleriaceae bacterium]
MGGALEQGNVGRVVVVRPGRAEELVRVTGDDREGQVLTVCIAPPETLRVDPHSRLPVPSEVPGAHLVGLLSWGAGDVSTGVELDVVRGVVLSVPAAALTLSVRHELPPSAPGPVYQCAATVAYGTRAGASPTRTRYASTGPGGVVDVEVAAFAASVRVHAREPFVPYGWGFVDAGGEPLTTGGVATRAGEASLLVIPNGANALRLVTAAAGVRFAVVFGLSL